MKVTLSLVLLILLASSMTLPDMTWEEYRERVIRNLQTV